MEHTVRNLGRDIKLRYIPTSNNSDINTAYNSNQS